MNEKRTLSRIMALAIAFAMAVIMMPQTALAAGDSSQQASSIVEMNGEYYDHLQDAIDDAPVGTATDITLLKDAVDTKPVKIGDYTGDGPSNLADTFNGAYSDNKIINLNLNGFEITIDDSNNSATSGDIIAVGVYGDSQLNLDGDGEFNVIMTDGGLGINQYAVVAMGNSKAEVTNCTGNVKACDLGVLIINGDVIDYSGIKFTVSVETDFGGTVTVYGNVESNSLAVWAGYSKDGTLSTTTIYGDIKSSTYNIAGIIGAGYGGIVKIHGDVIAELDDSDPDNVFGSNAIHSYDSGSLVWIGGDVTVCDADADYMAGPQSDGGALMGWGGDITVEGNVFAPIPVYANDSSNIIVKGSVTRTGFNSLDTNRAITIGSGMTGNIDNTTVYVHGNVIGGVSVEGGGEVTIDGTITGDSYIEFHDSATSYKRAANANNFDVTTTKAGYLTYSYKDSDPAIGTSSVWVKDNGQFAPTNPSTNSSSNDSSSDDTYYGGSNIGTGNSTQPGNANTDVTNTVAANAAKNAAAAAKTANATIATAAFQNPANISLAALNAMNSEADMPLRLRADSMNGASVDVRITLDPARSTRALNLSASTSNQAARNTVAIFKRYFDNDVMVVSLGQQGSFGQSVEIAAKLAPGLDTSNLVFYSYNAETNRYTRIATSYWVDKNGYVHFTTTLAGDIIISDGNLVKK